MSTLENQIYSNVFLFGEIVASLNGHFCSMPKYRGKECILELIKDIFKSFDIKSDWRSHKRNCLLYKILFSSCTKTKSDGCIFIRLSKWRQNGCIWCWINDYTSEGLTIQGFNSCFALEFWKYVSCRLYFHPETKKAFLYFRDHCQRFWEKRI